MHLQREVHQTKTKGHHQPWQYRAREVARKPPTHVSSQQCESRVHAQPATHNSLAKSLPRGSNRSSPAKSLPRGSKEKSRELADIVTSAASDGRRRLITRRCSLCQRTTHQKSLDNR